jgi:hypothetical protein
MRAPTVAAISGNVRIPLFTPMRLAKENTNSLNHSAKKPKAKEQNQMQKSKKQSDTRETASDIEQRHGVAVLCGDIE